MITAAIAASPVPPMSHRSGRCLSAIQSQLIYDYQTNLASYASWQVWLRQHALPTLVLWGRYDQAFTVPGAWAFRNDLPDAEIHILDAGHFAMDTRLGEVEALTRSFLSTLPAAAR